MPDSVRIAQSFLELLYAGEFTSALETLDPTMRAAVNDVELSQMWERLTTKFGAPVRHSDTRTAKTISSNLDIVYLSWDFAKERLCARIVVNDANQIAGVSFESPVIR